MVKGAFSRKSRRISLAAMFAAFTLIFLYLACILPAARLSMYFLCSVFIMGLVVEDEPGLAILMFLSVCGLSLLIMPDKLRVWPYVLFFGHYGLGKYYIEKIKDKFVAFIIKLLYYNAALVGMYFLCYSVLLADLSILETLPFGVIIAAAQIVFVVYDFLYSKVTSYYCDHIRRWLNK